MIAAADRALLDKALGDALGAEAVRHHEPIELDGATIGVTLAPADLQGVCDALRLLGERGLAAIVRGGGSKLALGNPPRRADVLLSTQRLHGIPTLDADDGVVQVRAGTPVAELRRAALAVGWDVGLDACDPVATVGGVLAAGEVGPRCLHFGRPRDLVLGLDVALASGDRARCGGRVVKNVTGYDLAKLYVGSLGTLCVIESAWLRLRPAARTTRTLLGGARDVASAVIAARSAARCSTVRVAALLDTRLLACVMPAGTAAQGATQSGLALLVEHAGDEALVDSESRRLERELALAPADDASVERLATLQGEAPSAEFLRFRIAFRPSRAAATLEALRRTEARVVAHVDAAHLIARFAFAGADEIALGAILRGVREAQRVGEGNAVLEAAPAWVKQGRDVFGGAGDAVALMHAVKRRFDPHDVLAPGRLAGGV